MNKNIIISVVAVALIALIALFAIKPKPTTVDKKAISTEHAVFVLGEESAPLTLLDISNYTCVHCRDHAVEVLDTLISKYVDTGKMRIVFQDFSNNSISQKAAESASCAAEQDSFMPYHMGLFRSYDQLVSQSESTVVPFLEGLASQFGLDTAKFNSCLEGGKFAKSITDATRNALDIGLDGTPFFNINGKTFSGARSMSEWETTIAEAEKALETKE